MRCSKVRPATSPSRRFRQLLVESVNHVLELARGEANYRRLIEHTTATDFQFELSNDEELIEPLIILVQQMVAGMGLCDAAGRLQVGVALEQALLNAMYHGNLELTTPQLREIQAHEGRGGLCVAHSAATGRANPTRDRKVFVRAPITRDEARLTVRDEGDGFDVQSSLDVTVSR